METKSKWIRKGFFIGIPLGLVSWLVWAGSSSTTLPNGAELQVSIDDPVTSTEFKVPADQSDIDIVVTGTTSVGEGEADATFVYVMDVSGSTDRGSGTGCAPILDCEQEFIKALNDAVVADGSSDEVGVVVYGDSAATADMQPGGGDQIITAPAAGPGDIDTIVDSTFSVFAGNGGVGQFTNKVVGISTNCTGGLESALDVVNASSNGTNVVVFVSDGVCTDDGGGLAAFNAAITALSNVGAVVNTVATGTGNTCDSSLEFEGTLQDIADGTGGECFEVEDPGMLPDIIPSLIGTTLESLEISVDGGAYQAIPNSDISDCTLPEPGAVTCNYQTTVPSLVPGDHEICVRANGSDVTGAMASVTQCETIHLLQLTATPALETNELGSDNEHTVTATILGDPAQVGGRKVDFVVSGQNPTLESEGTCSPNADCKTDASGEVSFSYTVPVVPDSLGTDTITVSTVIASMADSVDLSKDWVDTTPPVAECVETVNPRGNKKPQAPGTGQNEDGFYQLLATDDVWPVDALDMFVTDSGSGTVFGPFSVRDNIKYTEDDLATPESKKMGTTKGKGDAITAHIIGNGDGVLTAVDGSGNVSDPVYCLVPEPPK